MTFLQARSKPVLHDALRNVDPRRTRCTIFSVERGVFERGAVLLFVCWEIFLKGGKVVGCFFGAVVFVVVQCGVRHAAQCCEYGVETIAGASHEGVGGGRPEVCG